MAEWKTNVLIGQDLKKIIQDSGAASFSKTRFLVEEIKENFAQNIPKDVLLLYGLRRSGKTVALLQVVRDMDDVQFEQTAYISCEVNQTLSDVVFDLKQLEQQGFSTVIIDEITILEDFPDAAAILFDYFAMSGMKIALAGTDSLGFQFALHSSLFGRASTIHTTVIPFYEFHSIFPEKTLDEYIEHGGTLMRDDEKNSPFYNKNATIQYIDSAIAKNIQHSLENYSDGMAFGALRNLYANGELTNAIQRIVQQKNREFFLRIIERKFKSADFGAVETILDQRYKDTPLGNPMGNLNKNQIVDEIKQRLDILNQNERNIPITQEAIYQIEHYLSLLDLTMYIPVHHVNDQGTTLSKQMAFTLPGLRYSQVKEFMDVLAKDPTFLNQNPYVKFEILKTADQNVKGILLEEICFNTIIPYYERLGNQKGSINPYQVYQINFSFQNDPNFQDGEIDLVVQDDEKMTVKLYEIKHSSEIVPEQYKHLKDPMKLKYFTDRGYTIDSCNVLYMGENNDIDSQGVHYINAEEFLDSFKYLDPNYDRWKEDLDPLQKNIWKELSSYYNGCVSVKEGKPIKLMINQKSIEQTFDNMTDVVDAFKDKIVQTIQKGTNPFSENLIQFYGLQEMAKGLPNCYESSEESKSANNQKEAENTNNNNVKKKPADPDTRG